MKVFISWSGKTSRRIAETLRDWLPQTLQVVEPWLSSEDIPLGSKWVYDISKILETADIGIVCLTSDNINSSWLHYEAGALSKNVGLALVCIYAFNIETTDIQGPLSLFQCAKTNKEDTFKLLKTLNSVSKERVLSDEHLRKVFDVWWPVLEKSLNEIMSEESQDKDESKTSDEKLDEILSILKAGRTELLSNKETERDKSEKVINPQKSTIGRRPTVFIGSSTEGLRIAEAIQVGLEPYAECTIWNQTAFDLSQTTIESVVDISSEFDFAVIVLSADDMLEKRGVSNQSPRDNIIFELGLFTGALGRARTFMVYNREAKMHLPSDLAGVTAATFSDRSDNNLVAALGPVCVT